MKTLDYLKLDPKSTEKTINGLQELLANLQLYYTNLRGFHWNVKGLEFFGLHAKLEEFYDDTAEKVDEVAERILMLGGVPEHNFSEYLKNATIKETAVVSNTKEIVKNVLDSLKVLISLEREVLETASEGSDEVTVSLLSDFLAGQEKNVWMLTAFLS
ncbi:MAG: DNA starvation/stationary phase protection protein [Bacteroidetes bacterium GWD2_45_23]|nr:MAG: DNA starvation/stationary phase protection protein [Bacteroidetes bacterium GWC2_46_850]OFX80127.1 MAG: DNA starvation/stationary phase protection protein [Bacteroidetes bacterium GWC1_47_7]OFX85228.1 MAG: DNA starvation/stationary phase protection protein [Bacteroidetes bacterium GWD2_45_23]HAR37433.1 DNA starvation/stationary phase protection protein [Porphyromonadaceae bacterium]HBB00902.1 DNA starvation/stationary phase protection protein [Porphyromonadaceae bacterium]